MNFCVLFTNLTFFFFLKSTNSAKSVLANLSFATCEQWYNCILIRTLLDEIDILKVGENSENTVDMVNGQMCYPDDHLIAPKIGASYFVFAPASKTNTRPEYSNNILVREMLWIYP